MNDTPTPKTDVIRKQLGDYMAKGFHFAPVLEAMEKLERERDEALREGDKQSERAAWYERRFQQAQDALSEGLAATFNERDALRAELEALKSSGMMLPYAKLELEAACVRLSAELEAVKGKLATDLRDDRAEYNQILIEANEQWERNCTALRMELEAVKKERDIIKKEADAAMRVISEAFAQVSNDRDSWEQATTRISNEYQQVLKECRDATDVADLMHDEFERIVALLRSYSLECDEHLRQEILGLCERATSKIRQLVPVITQRNEAQISLRKSESQLSALSQTNAKLREALEKSVQALQLANDQGKEFAENGKWSEETWSQHQWQTNLASKAATSALSLP